MTLTTTTTKVLETVRAEGTRGAAVKDVVKATGLGDTTVRKALDDLVRGGFLTKDKPGATMLFFDVQKDDLEDEPTKGEEVKNVTDTSTTPQQRGRPRDPKAIERDEKVLGLIAKAGDEGIGIGDLAEKADCTTQLAYLSVYRLRKEGKITSARNGSRTPQYKLAG